MFNPFAHEDSDLDAAIASAYSDLKSFSADEEGYRNAVSQLKELYALKHKTAELTLKSQESYAEHQLEQDKNAWAEEQESRPFFKRVDPNTALTVAGNLAIALFVVKYEQTGVISSKVTSFMKKI